MSTRIGPAANAFVPAEPPETQPPVDPELAVEPTANQLKLWIEAKIKSEAACLLPPRYALEASKYEMADDGLGEKMLDHFLSGKATPVHVDLSRELERNPRLVELLASRIETEISTRLSSGESIERMSGAIWVSQPDYGISEAGMDQRFAFGGTYFEYDVVGTAADGGLLLQLTVSDHYLWSPNEERPTKCLHACGAALVATGEMTEFHQFGQGELIVADPRVEPPALEPPAEEEVGK